MSKLTSKSIAMLLAGFIALCFVAGCSSDPNAKSADPILSKKDSRDAGISAKQDDAANPDK